MHRATIAFVFFLTLAGPSLTFAIGDATVDIDEEFSTFEQLPEAPSPEERIAEYDSLLAGGTPEGEPYRLVSVPRFSDIAIDFSAITEPQEALAAATYLNPEPSTAELYENLGVATLAAARQARLSGNEDRALSQLSGARHFFELATRAPSECAKVDVAKDRRMLHRAMVELEEMTVTGSGATIYEAEKFLDRQLELTPSGPLADWAWRYRLNPRAYARADEPMPTTANYVGGDLRRPVKIFAPQPRYSAEARKLCIQGVMILQALVDRDGRVAAFRVLKDLPGGLTEEALRTLATWVFEPAKLNGVPTPVLWNLTMQYRLDRLKSGHDSAHRTSHYGSGRCPDSGKPSLLGQKIQGP